MRMMLPGVAHCSQMSNPKAGTGSGGDRCCEAVAAMLFCSFIDTSKDPEQIMYRITEAWNNGSDTSALESAQKILDDIHAASSGAVTFSALSPSFESVKEAVGRGHVLIVGVNDYRQLKDFAGHNPYQWNEATQPAAGHVLLAIGFDDDFQGHGQTIIVMDPLRSIDGQPYDYSASSIGAAGFDSLTEVLAPSLIPAPPPPPPGREYTVQPGDNLWNIASREYHDPFKWRDIYAANKDVIGADPDLIHTGLVLMLP